MQHHTVTRNALIATALVCGITSASAQESAASIWNSPTATGLLLGKFPGETAMDRAWSAFDLYKDDSNPILQQFSLQGRVQLQTIHGVEGGDNDFSTSDYKAAGNNESVWGNDIEVRRARLGFKSKWYQNWKLEGQIDVDANGKDNGSKDTTYYKDLYDLYLTYAPSDALNVSVGKTKVKFTREQEISSKEIITIERSLLSNTLFPGELTGVWVNGKGIADYWLYEMGVYGNDRMRGFADLDGGTIFLGKIGYDYSSAASLDSAVVSLHVMHNTEPGFQSKDKDSNYSFSESPRFENSIALTNDIVQGRFGLTTDVVYGFGYEGVSSVAGKSTKINQSDVYGISLIPSYFIADGLQLVGRVQLASSPGANGLRVPSRYERLAKGDDESGNTYASAYLGLNYYLYGHKLKLMNGIEYSEMGGGSYDGYTIMSGLRFSF